MESSARTWSRRSPGQVDRPPPWLWAATGTGRSRRPGARRWPGPPGSITTRPRAGTLRGHLAPDLARSGRPLRSSRLDPAPTGRPQRSVGGGQGDFRRPARPDRGRRGLGRHPLGGVGDDDGPSSVRSDLVGRGLTHSRPPPPAIGRGRTSSGHFWSPRAVWTGGSTWPMRIPCQTPSTGRPR